MKKKAHLTREQRYQISALLQAGHSQKEIAEVIGKDKSVVSRELRRNSGKRGYSAQLAQQMADERKERLRSPRKFTEGVRRRIVEDLVVRQYSPEQIAGLARRQGRQMVSHTLIYRFIREDKEHGGKLYTHLRHRLKHRKRPVGGQCGIKGRVSIDHRPAVVEKRSRVGEGDRHDNRQGRQRGDSRHNRAQDWIPADGETQGRERCHGAGKDGGETAAIQGMGAHDNLGQRHGIRQA